MEHRLSGLDAAVLASESSRIPLHSLALCILDPTTMSSAAVLDALRDGLLNGVDTLPRLRGRLLDVPFGLAPPDFVESRVDAGLHVDRIALPAPGGPRQLARAVAERAEQLIDRSRPLWQITLIDGLSSGSIAALVKLHAVPLDGTFAADLPGRIGSGSPDSLPAWPAGPAPHPVRPGRPFERLTDALPDIAAQPLQLARAGARAVRALARSTIEGKVGVSNVVRPAPHAALNRRSSARRSVAHTSLRMTTLRELAERSETGWREVFLTALSGALRSELERTEGAPPTPLVACVIDAAQPAIPRGGSARSHLPTIRRRRLFTELPQASARLAQIAAAGAGDAADPAIWPRALAGILDASSPLLLSLFADATARLRPRTSAAPPFHVLVSLLDGPGKRTFIGGARLEHVYPLNPIIDGVNLHVAAWHGEGSLDVGILACRRFMPDAWPMAAALSDAVAELTALCLAAPGR